LIQILCINSEKPADAELAGAKLGRVNRDLSQGKRRNSAPGDADAAGAYRKSRKFPATALYRAVTLSRVMPKKARKTRGHVAGRR